MTNSRLQGVLARPLPTAQLHAGLQRPLQHDPGPRRHLRVPRLLHPDHPQGACALTSILATLSPRAALDFPSVWCVQGVRRVSLLAAQPCRVLMVSAVCPRPMPERHLQAFGIPTWGATHSGHAAMTSWNPAGWVRQLQHCSGTFHTHFSACVNPHAPHIHAPLGFPMLMGC